MKARSIGSRLALFAFVLALLLKSAIPLFASWSAQLQGKAVAEVCDVYGVALPAQAGHVGHDMHAMHGAHAMHAIHAMASEHPDDAPPHRHDPSSHAGDHCVLSGLVAFAGVAGDLPALPSAARRDLVHALAWSAEPIGADASARWAARLGHGPPDFS